MMVKIKANLRIETIQDGVVVYDPAMQAAFAAKNCPNETPSEEIRKILKEILRTKKLNKKGTKK